MIKGLDPFKAKSALSVVMNVKNGEIIAMVSLPDFDPNFPKTIQAFTENNLVTEARYEMGSTLKMFNAALAFEFDKEITKKEFNIANGYQITEEKKITDEHINKEIINFDECLFTLQNVASVKIIDLIGIEEQQNLFRKIGLVENPK